MVRIISGHWKGRRIKTTEGEGYRPAMGRVREALFSMLAARGVLWESARVLDIFAGSGSLGWEALSRGAREVCFLESDAKAVQLLRSQVPAFDRAGQHVTICPGDALRILAGKPKQGGYDVVFLDPPYGRDLLVPALNLTCRQGWIARDALVCAEVEERWSPSAVCIVELELETDRTYGQTRICLWRWSPSKQDEHMASVH